MTTHTAPGPVQDHGAGAGTQAGIGGGIVVHEAYLRLVGPREAQRWDGRGHFFAAASEAMRRILVERCLH